MKKNFFKFVNSPILQGNATWRNGRIDLSFFWMRTLSATIRYPYAPHANSTNGMGIAPCNVTRMSLV